MNTSHHPYFGFNYQTSPEVAAALMMFQNQQQPLDTTSSSMTEPPHDQQQQQQQQQQLLLDQQQAQIQAASLVAYSMTNTNQGQNLASHFGGPGNHFFGEEGSMPLPHDNTASTLKPQHDSLFAFNFPTDYSFQQTPFTIQQYQLPSIPSTSSAIPHQQSFAYDSQFYQSSTSSFPPSFLGPDHDQTSIPNSPLSPSSLFQTTAYQSSSSSSPTSSIFSSIADSPTIKSSFDLTRADQEGRSIVEKFRERPSESREGPSACDFCRKRKVKVRKLNPPSLF